MYVTYTSALPFKILSQPRINHGYDLLQNFRPIPLQLEVGTKLDSEYVTRPVCPTEETQERRTFPCNQPQADRLITVNLGPYHRLICPDFSSRAWSLLSKGTNSALAMISLSLSPDFTASSILDFSALYTASIS